MSFLNRKSGLARSVDSSKNSLAKRDKKTAFDYLTAASSFSSAILVAIIGAFVTLIQQRSVAANQKLEQMRIDAAKTAELAHQNKQDIVTETAGIQNRRILAVQTVGQFMPYLTSKDEIRQKWAITAISALSTSADPNDTLAVSLAKLNPTAGSKAALESIAANAISEEAKRNARSALSGFQASNITQMSRVISTSTNELGSAVTEADSLHEQAQDERVALNFYKTQQLGAYETTSTTPISPTSNLALSSKYLLACIQAYMDVLAAFADNLPNTQVQVRIQSFENQQNSMSPPADISEAIAFERNILDATKGTHINAAQFVQKSDPYVELLCRLLQGNIAVLRTQRNRDTSILIDSETLFLQSPDGFKLEPDKRQEAIRKLAELQRKQRAGDAALAETESSIVRLQSMHHALAADMQGNNPHARIAQFISSTRSLK